MVSWSEHDVNAFNARTVKQPAKRGDSEAREADLHEKIMAECKRRGWRTVHSRMNAAATIEVGTCDFIIFADNARVFLCECKTATGKLSEDQTHFIAWLKRLGHNVAVITSFQQFLELTR
jgi:hypothetical protein